MVKIELNLNFKDAQNFESTLCAVLVAHDWGRLNLDEKSQEIIKSIIRQINNE